MQSFTDTAGRKWTFELTAYHLRLIKSELGIDLLADATAIEAVAGDVSQLVDLLEVVTREQREKIPLSVEGFVRGLGGDTLDPAMAALAEEVIAAFPQSRRAAIRAAWEKLLQMNARATEYVVQTINSPQMEQRLQAELEKAAGTLWMSGSPSSS